MSSLDTRAEGDERLRSKSRTTRREEGGSSQPGGRSERGSAGRPRSEEAHRAILGAAIELLAESGFSALTVEGVAQRAGVGKATIYRRWSSKVPLVVEAFRELPKLEDPDSGDVESDLVQMLERYLREYTQSPLSGVVSSLAGERAPRSRALIAARPAARRAASADPPGAAPGDRTG